MSHEVDKLMHGINADYVRYRLLNLDDETIMDAVTRANSALSNIESTARLRGFWCGVVVAGLFNMLIFWLALVIKVLWK